MEQQFYRTLIGCLNEQSEIHQFKWSLFCFFHSNNRLPQRAGQPVASIIWQQLRVNALKEGLREVPLYAQHSSEIGNLTGYAFIDAHVVCASDSWAQFAVQHVIVRLPRKS